MLRRTFSRVSLLALAAATAGTAPGTGHAAGAPVSVNLPTPVAVSSGAWAPDATNYGVYTKNDIPVTMSDGVVLRANIGVPLTAGETAPQAGDQYPVLIEQTPYRKDGGLFTVDSYFVSRGFAMVVIDVRGTGSSEGEWDSFGPLEREDGPQIVRWAAHQPWANGTAGLMGASYLAINQFLTMEQPDAPTEVKAMFANVPMSDSYRDVVFHGGNFDQAFMAPWLGLVTALGAPPANQTTDGNLADAQDGLTVALNHAQGDQNFQAQVIPQVVTGGPMEYDGDFYTQRSPLTHVDRVTVPTTIIGGEFDLFQRGEPLLYNGLVNAPAKRLAIGPWIHLQGSEGSSQLDTTSEKIWELQWFDHYLRGQDAGLGLEPQVLQYQMQGVNTGGWVPSATYPASSPTGVNYYLDGGRTGLAQSTNDGALSTTPPAIAGQDVLPYTVTGTGCVRTTFQWGDASAWSPGTTVPCETDERPQEATELTYSLPLTSDLTINGPINVHLVAESPLSRDITFTVHLTDVDPVTGQSTDITSGWLLSRFRAEAPSPVTLYAGNGPLLRVFHPFTPASEAATPAGATDYNIEVFPTYNLFKTGDQLRLDVGTGDAPHSLPSAPNLASSAGAVFLIDRGGVDPSYVTLPVVG
ncbi:MAG: CocE/NonD family hydrolase [Candidatus Dormibacteria bacterium]